jgi:hypothetical protein
MASPTMRRPLPALVFLVALTLLAALVWWRVLSRSHHSTGSAKKSCSTSSASTKLLPAPPTVTVVVLNSTKRQGLAGSVRAVLVKDGFLSPDPAANDRTVRAPLPGVAEIRYPPAQLPAAKLLAYYLPGATLKPSTATDGKVVVSLGTKFKAVATPAAVTAALARDKVSEQRVASAAPAPSSTPSC